MPVKTDRTAPLISTACAALVLLGACSGGGGDGGSGASSPPDQLHGDRTQAVHARRRP